MPKELGNLINLEDVLLLDNRFQGKLYVQHTCVKGSLTFSLFAGELPKELGNLVNLKVLDLQRNGFTGAIVCPSIHSVVLDIHRTLVDKLRRGARPRPKRARKLDQSYGALPASRQH